MKYWVYKDSRILGPFEKDAFEGLPGIDSSTLVCAGDSAATMGGDWRPAGDVAELATVPLDRGVSWPAGDSPSTFSLLDNLQIDAAGLIADDDFPGAAEDLFQDPDTRRALGAVLGSPVAHEAELRHAKDKVTELTIHLETLHRRVSDLEADQVNLAHELAEKEAQLRARTPPLVPPAVSTAPPPPPSPTPASAAAVPSAALSLVAPAPVEPPPVQPASAEPPSAPSADTMPPAAPSGATLPPPIAPAAKAVTLKKFKIAGAAPIVPAAAPAGEEVPPPAKAFAFQHKTFKIVPTVKAFRSVGAQDIPPAGLVPPPAAALEPMPAVAEAAEPMALEPLALQPAAIEPSTPVAEPAAIELQPVAPVSVPSPWDAVPAPAPVPAVEASPSSVPPAISPFGGPAPFDAGPAPFPNFFDPAAAGDASTGPGVSLPPATVAFSRPVDEADALSTQEVLARLAKPAQEAAPAAARRPRGNKMFFAFVGVAAALLGVVWFFFLRHPKELRQMAELDDGRARVGAEAGDDASRPLVKPLPAVAPAPSAQPPVELPTSPAPQAPAPAPPEEAAQAADHSKLDAAIAMVKEFPLDGQRGAVGRWLQYSYSATPDSGKESWSASETGDKSYLVEYRFTPSAPGGTEVHYLFEADMAKGFVSGKNPESARMLAGETPRDASQIKLDAAIAAVKDFPLDGGKGTVAEFLQPSSGRSSVKGSWSASVGEGKSYLVEYRSKGGTQDIFEVDMESGLVLGKNADARRILSGGSAPGLKPKTKKRAVSRKRTPPRRSARRAVVAPKEEPQDVPLLPLPSEGEARTPAEDDGAFQSDTVNAGL